MGIVQSFFRRREAVVLRAEDNSLDVYLTKYHQGAVSRLLDTIGVVPDSAIGSIVFHIPRRKFGLKEYLHAKPAPERLKEVILSRSGQVRDDVTQPAAHTGTVACPNCAFLMRPKPEQESKVKHAFYAVKVGRRPGIYNDPQSAASQVDGISGGKRKAFTTLIDAIAYLNDGKNIRRDDPPKKSDNSGSKPVYEHLYFVVKQGYRPGVYDDESAAEYHSIDGAYHGFMTLEEAEAFYREGKNSRVRKTATSGDTVSMPIIE